MVVRPEPGPRHPSPPSTAGGDETVVGGGGGMAVVGAVFGAPLPLQPTTAATMATDTTQARATVRDTAVETSGPSGRYLARVRGPVMVNVGGFGDQLLGFMQHAMPGEEVVVAALDGGPLAAGGEILATLPVDATSLERALTPSVRWVHVLGAGVDRFPLEAVGDRMLTCSRGASSVAIAEFVLAVMLAFEKHLPESWVDAPPPQWNIASLGGLRGRTLGIIGLGAIGTEIAKRALAFDMVVVAVRRTSTPTPTEGVHVTGSLNHLLGQSDHVVVAAPATPETYHLIDATTLAAMKGGAHLVNVGRGSLVDQPALLAALDDGHLGMASLDVVDPEPLPAGHPFFSHPKVRISPHISWSSPDTARRTHELFVENVRRYRAGAPLHGVVDIAAGY